MAKLFPRRSSPSVGSRDPRVVDLEDEDADAVFSALSSETARQLYARLQDEPATPSDLAEAIDSSIQNVRYHIEKMEEAGLIEVVDTWYSSRGNEMSVYAAADGPLILASDRSAAERLKGALGRLVGGVAVLAGISVLIQYALIGLFTQEEEIETGGTESDDDVGITTEDVEQTGNGAEETVEVVVSTVPPGVLFFLGGLVVLVLATAIWYHRSY